MTETRAWKIFFLFPVFLLRRPASSGHVSREDLSDRFDKFTQGEWLALYNDAILSDQKVGSRASAPTLAAIGRAACQKVQLGEVSRARQCLTGASVAQGNEEAFRAMQDRRPQEVVKEIPADVLNFQPETPVVLDRSILLKSLHTARRGSSPGPGGYAYEHFKALMDDTDAFALFFKAALEEVTEAPPREQMYTFLDDVYIVCQPERVRVLFDMLVGALTRVAGIRPHDGKTRV